MAKTSGLAKALRSRIGRACWFKHPSGRIIEGSFGRGRVVTELTGMTVDRSASATGRTVYNMQETKWTVPGHVRIHFGQAPTKVKK